MTRKQLDRAIRRYARVRSWLLRGAITHGPPASRVALTFDDGPDRRFTGDVLEILAKQGARASFFMVGRQVERDPELARDLVMQGHEPCTHLYTHDREVARDEKRFVRELDDSLRILERVTGARPRFLRFPFAFLGPQRPADILARFGVRTVHWSFSSVDSRLDAPRIARRVGRLLFPGAIVLLHDGVGDHSRFSRDRRETVRALPDVLDHCRARGLKPVTLSELLDLSFGEADDP